MSISSSPRVFFTISEGREISPEYSLEGLMLKLKLQYFGHLMRRVDSFAGRDWGAGGKGDNRG